MVCSMTIAWKIPAFLALLLFSLSVQASPPAHPPRLVVVIAVPGFRSDYLHRFHPVMNENGLQRFLNKGARFLRARTGLAVPLSGPAFATLATGVGPAHHGIVADRWWDRSGRKWKSPGLDQLDTLSLAARIKKSTRGEGKVLAVAWNRIPAHLMAGGPADAAYWFNPEKGAFVWRKPGGVEEPPDWMKENRMPGFTDRWCGKMWNRIFREEKFAACAEDDRAGEGGEAFKPAFPHPLPEDPEEYHRILGETPFADRLLFEVAAAAVLMKRLGKDKKPDLLYIALEGLSAVGRRFGPFSHEIMDTFVRLDRQLSRFLGLLDSQLGFDSWTAVLVGLNGMPLLVEESRDRGVNARRVRWADLLPFQEGKDPVKERVICAGPNLYLNLDRDQDAKGRAAVKQALQEKLLRCGGVHTVISAEQVEENRLPSGALGRAIRCSFHPVRSGDLVVILQPDSAWKDTPGPASPWPCNDHIVFLALGNGIRRGMYHRQVTLKAVAPTVAELMDLPFSVEEGEDPLKEALALRSRLRKQ